MCQKKFSVEELEAGFIVSDVQDQKVVRTACLTAASALAQVAVILGVSADTITVSAGPTAAAVEETQEGDDGKPRTPVDADNRQAVIKWLAERGIEVKSGQKNTTLTKMVQDTPVEILPVAEETPAAEEPPAEETPAAEEPPAEETPAVEEPIYVGGCILCGGKGKFLAGTPAECDCIVCKGTGSSDVDKLEAATVRTQVSCMIDKAPDAETRQKWIDDGVVLGQTKAGTSSLTKLPQGVTLISVFNSIVEHLGNVATVETSGDPEW